MNYDELKKEYDEKGFCIFRNVLDAGYIDELNQHVNWLLNKYNVASPEHLHHSLMRDDAFWLKAVSEPRLLDIAKIFLGPDIVNFTSHYICKPANTGIPVYWHQDGAYWNLTPMKAVTLWVAVDKSVEENGCLFFIPGSHKQPLRPLQKDQTNKNLLSSTISNEYFDSKDSVAVELQPGDISVHHTNVIHGSPANTSNMRRCGLDIGYTNTSVEFRKTQLYTSPFLLTESIIKDPSIYAPWPQFKKGDSMPFTGQQKWNDTAKRMNQCYGFKSEENQESVMEITNRMVKRLAEVNTSKEIYADVLEKNTRP